MNAYIDGPPFLIENNKQTNVSFRIKESKCVCVYWHTDNFQEYLNWKEAFAHTCELSQGSREHPAACPHGQAVPHDSAVF